jgi:hypothetical protein
MRTLVLGVLTVLGLVGVGSSAAHAQTVTFLNAAGQPTSSWGVGERITLVVTGGGSNAKLVQLHWQNGNAGAPTNVIGVWAYNPRVGFRHTFVAGYPSAVSITAQVKYGPRANEWITMRTIWRR